MSVDVERLTDRDIREYKRDLEGYKKKKRVFLILGFVFLGVTIILIALSVFLGIVAGLQQYENESIYAASLSLSITTGVFASVFLEAMIIMFILQGALFAAKINNRIVAIEEYEVYKQAVQKEIDDIKNENKLNLKKE